MALVKRDSHKKKGLEWFFNELRKASKDINYNAYNPTTDPLLGGMFSFIYDPKWKDKLPYWDRLPLVIPFNFYGDGFIGINLHYADGGTRAKLLQFLLRLHHRKTVRDATRVSYQILQTVVKADALQPCIHRYLNSHIRTRLVKISMEEWENVASLPLAQWKKPTKS